MDLIKILVLILFLGLINNGYTQEKEPGLSIRVKAKHYSFSRSNLLSMKGITHISMNNNRAYPKIPMTYTAIKLSELLQPYAIKPTDTLEFIAADGFCVLIPAGKIMNGDKRYSIAYLAIEPATKWPLLKYNTGTTAGPYDVIWLHPEKSYISDEYWVWSIIKIVVHKKLNSKLVPAKPNIKNRKMQNHIGRGYDIYISHCAGCHSINHIGKGVIGPDLNLPKNPVEYYPNDDLLKKFIRDPQSVRVIKYDRMSGSNEQFLSNSDLNDLIGYFHYMANHKVSSKIN